MSIFVFNFFIEISSIFLYYNNDIIESGILFDNNSNGDHIERWITVINMFDKYKRGV